MRGFLNGLTRTGGLNEGRAQCETRKMADELSKNKAIVSELKAQLRIQAEQAWQARIRAERALVLAEEQARVHAEQARIKLARARLPFCGLIRKMSSILQSGTQPDIWPKAGYPLWLVFIACGNKVKAYCKFVFWLALFPV